MAHIDFDAISSLDALIDVSDAGARATMIRLREQLELLASDLDERLVIDGRHRKPALGFFRGAEPVLHVFPEPGVATGLHVAVPVRTWERKLLDTRGLAPWLEEALRRGRPRHNVIWIESTLHSPSRADQLVELLQRRLDLLPRLH